MGEADAWAKFATSRSRLQHEEVFLDGRSIPSWPLAISLLASVATGVGVVSHSAHQYAYGFNLAWNVAAIAMTTPCTVYFFLPVLYELKVTSVFQGGLRGVVWADCVQGIVLFAAPFVIIGKIIYDSAHLDVPLRPLSDIDPSQWFMRFEADASSDETVWTHLVATLPFHLVREGMDQMVAQRFLAARSIHSARRVMWVGTTMLAFFVLSTTFTGLALTYWYRDCDPMLAGIITRYDQVVVVQRTIIEQQVVWQHLAEQISTTSRALSVLPDARLSGTTDKVRCSRAHSTELNPSSAPGTAVATSIIFVLELWQTVGRTLSGIEPLRMNTTLERCNDAGSKSFSALQFLNASQAQASNSSFVIQRRPSGKREMDVFILYRLSSYWSSFIALLATVSLSLALSLIFGAWQWHSHIKVPNASCDASFKEVCCEEELRVIPPLNESPDNRRAPISDDVLI
ncbi:uncharacterized protein LOC119406810 [Rhipicephalus sanguineus]|uniref:uncharacterized protein LOC119406810 n=1 Tax=Rhipicephalus sanguineus TaxID=34632 RepID=UPI0018948CAD|nr:uncharacterized protein LOC119406810 [Rhipicephalus sanguineus]